MEIDKNIISCWHKQMLILQHIIQKPKQDTLGLLIRPVLTMLIVLLLLSSMFIKGRKSNFLSNPLQLFLSLILKMKYVPDGKKLEFLYFPSLDQVRNVHNHPRLILNPMHYKKKTFLNFKGIEKVLIKTIPQIRMFLNQIHVVNMNNEIAKVS